MKRITGAILCAFCVIASDFGIAAAPPASSNAHPVGIIFDTDIGNDVDDVLALALLHSLQTRGECELLAVTITKPDPLAVTFVDALNYFYRRPGIPIGITRQKPKHDASKFLKLAEIQDNGKLRYPHVRSDPAGAPDALQVFRKTLAGQPDGQVVLVQVGYFSNLAALLETGPDTVSDLPGLELVKRKVRLLSVMAGAFNMANHFLEYNVVQDLASSLKVCPSWPTPIVWSGFEIGIAVPFPAGSITKDFGCTPHHIVAEAYRLYEPPPHERPTWDLTSVLYAVRPDRGYFGLSEPGQVTVEQDGFTRFKAGGSGRDRYLTLDDVQKVRVRETLADLVSQPPKCP